MAGFLTLIDSGIYHGGLFGFLVHLELLPQDVPLDLRLMLPGEHFPGQVLVRAAQEVVLINHPEDGRDVGVLAPGVQAAIGRRVVVDLDLLH